MKASRIVSSTPSRVAGYRGSTPGGGEKFERLGFSPSANLIPGSAPSNGNWLAGLPHRSLITTVCPPIAFALPCRMFAAVTPPARSS